LSGFLSGFVETSARFRGEIYLSNPAITLCIFGYSATVPGDIGTKGEKMRGHKKPMLWDFNLGKYLNVNNLLFTEGD